MIIACLIRHKWSRPLPTIGTWGYMRMCARCGRISKVK